MSVAVSRNGLFMSVLSDGLGGFWSEGPYRDPGSELECFAGLCYYRSEWKSIFLRARLNSVLNKRHRAFVVQLDLIDLAYA